MQSAGSMKKDCAKSDAPWLRGLVTQPRYAASANALYSSSDCDGSNTQSV